MFLAGTGFILIQVISGALIGGALGIGVGHLSLRSTFLARTVADFLRIGMWIPVLLLWLIPVATHPEDWREVVFSVLFVNTLAVTTCTVRDYIVGKFVLDLRRSDLRKTICRTALLQALFVSVLSQPTLWPYGLPWYSVDGWRALVAPILICFILLAIDRFLPMTIQERSANCAKVLLIELNNYTWGRIKAAGLFGLLLICVWQFFSMSHLSTIVASPRSVLAAGYWLLANGNIWGHLLVSIGEIISGVTVAVGIGILCDWVLAELDTLAKFLLETLSFMFVTPIVALSVWPDWFQQFSFAHKVIGIGVLSFFPFFLAFWGLRERSFIFRILMGVDAALPFAFVAMLFTESMASTSGLGFSVGKATAQSHRFDGAALCFIITAMMLALSWTCKSMAKIENRSRI